MVRTTGLIGLGLFLIFLTSINIIYGSVFPENHHGLVDEEDLPPDLKAQIARQFCNNKEQSPIDIEDNKADQGPEGADLIFGKGYSRTLRFDLENPGHTIQCTFREPEELTVSGPTLTGEYKLAQFHFHWGKANDGSEHLINSQQYAGEIHLVHIRSNYSNITNALHYSKDRYSLMVIGIIVEEGASNHHPGFWKVSKSLVCINNTKKRAEKVTSPLFGRIMLKKLLPGGHGQKVPIYQYDGSLTTPPCNEAVHWIVFKNPIKVTSEQINALRHLYSLGGELLAGETGNNARAHEPLYARKVVKRLVHMRYI